MLKLKHQTYSTYIVHSCNLSLPVIPLPACPPRNCIWYLWYWAQITGTHYLMDVLTTGAFAVLCLWLPIYNLCHICQTLALCKSRKSFWETQPACSHLGEAGTRGHNIPRKPGAQATGQKCDKAPSKGENILHVETKDLCHDCLPSSWLGMNPACQAYRRGTSRIIVCKSSNRELRNVKQIFL